MLLNFLFKAATKKIPSEEVARKNVFLLISRMLMEILRLISYTESNSQKQRKATTNLAKIWQNFINRLSIINSSNLIYGLQSTRPNLWTSKWEMSLLTCTCVII
jgi:hypothetical protein